MNKGLVLFIAIVIIVGAGWLIFSQPGNDDDAAKTDIDEQALTVDSESNGDADTGENAALIEIAQKLQGAWTSQDDEKSVIEFDGNQKIDRYDGEELTAGSFVVTDDVSQLEFDGSIASGQFLVVQAQGDDMPFEYEIVSLTDTELTMFYLPRGNMLRYVR